VFVELLHLICRHVAIALTTAISLYLAIIGNQIKIVCIQFGISNKPAELTASHEC